MSITCVQKKEFTQGNKNLFIVSNTFQLLNAIEAQSFFKTDNNILVLLFIGPITGNQKNISKYIELFPHTQLITINMLNTNILIKTIELLNLLNKFEYDKVFTGFYSNNYKRILCNLEHNSLYLIDDGVYTNTVHNEIYNPLIVTHTNQRFSIKGIFSFIYKTYATYYLKRFKYSNTYENLKLNFFTVYPLIKYKSEDIINHSFKKLRQIFSNKKIVSEIIHENSVFFLGQPLEKLGNITHDDYLDYLKKISIFYQNRNLNLHYVPHPAENKILLDKIKALKNNKINFYTLDEPFEVYFLKFNNIKNIASFLSSALFNIKVIDKDVCIESFQVTTDKINLQNVLDMYKLFKSKGIPVHQI